MGTPGARNTELFSFYAAVVADLRHTDARNQLMRILTLFAALGRELPVTLRLPDLFLTDAWARYVAPTDHEAEFVTNSALFRDHVTRKVIEWQPRWDEHLSRITADNPTLARAAVLDVCGPARSVYQVLCMTPARLTWAAWKSLQSLRLSCSTLAADL